MSTLKDIIHYVLGKTDWMKTAVGLFFLYLFDKLVNHLLETPIPIENSEVVLFTAGEIAGAALTIAAYYFGSSKGSQDKSETIKRHIADDKRNEQTTE